MTKRPTIGPEAVVRKSRLATKGEAVPALVHGHHHHLDHPAAASAEPLVQSLAPEDEGGSDGGEDAAPQALQSVVDGLMAALAERDRQLEQVRADLLRLEQERLQERAAAAQEAERQLEALRADLLRLEQERLQERAALALEHERQLEPLRADLLRSEQERLQERAAAVQEHERQLGQLRADLLRLEQERLQERATVTREHDQHAANLAAADATIDELRNRVSDLREQLDHARAEVSRLIEQHASERQRMLDHHKAESDRLVEVSRAAAPPPAADGVLQSAKRWLFGDDPEAKAPSQVNQRSVVAQQKSALSHQAKAAVVQNPGPNPAPAKATVVKPVGPPTAPKILNRRPVG